LVEKLTKETKMTVGKKKPGLMLRRDNVHRKARLPGGEPANGGAGKAGSPQLTKAAMGHAA